MILPGTVRINRNLIFYNLIMIGLISLAAIYELHRLLGGLILQSIWRTWLLFVPLLFLFSLSLWPWNKIELRKNKDLSWIFISIFGAILVLFFWMGRNSLGGDYSYHKMFVLQLLNGYPESHIFYRGAPGFYPPLAHAAIAVIANLTFLSVHHAYLLLTVVIAVLIPAVSYFLGEELGFSKSVKFFFAALLLLYYWEDSFFRYGLGLFLPTIGRNLSLLLFLIFLSLWIKQYNKKTAFNYSLALSLGITSGLIGLTHPTAFMLSEVFLFVGLSMDLFRNNFNFNKLIPLGCSLLISSLHYIPLLWDIIYYSGITKVVQNMDMHITAEKIQNTIFNPVMFLAIYAFLTSFTKEAWVRVCSCILILLILSLFVFSSMGNFTDILFVLRNKRFVHIVFLCIALLAAKGLDNICNLKIKKIQSFPKYFIFAMIAVIFVSYYLLINHIREIRSQIDLKTSVLAYKNLNDMLPDGIANVDEMRQNISNLKGVFMVPPEWAMLIAKRVGMDIPYIERPRIHFKSFLKKTTPQEERLKNVALFYDNINQGILRYDILDFFGAKVFLSTRGDLDKLYNLAKKKSIGRDKVIWYVYELK